MDRERLTITLRKDLLRRVDGTIDGARIRNRSHAIEYLISIAFPSNVKKALVLAGGQGIKMRPLTYELPKPMIPVGGRPILDHIIEYLRENEIRDIIILIGPLGEKIKHYFGDGSKFGVKISYIEEDKPSGTATPIKKAQNLIGDERFILIYGDVLVQINLKEMAEYHLSSQSLMTMALTTVQEAGEWGVVGLRGNRVVSFTEKPHREGFSKLISAGIFILEPAVFNLIPNKPFSMLEEDVLPRLIKSGKVAGYNFDGLWFDIATPEIYANALKYWKK